MALQAKSKQKLKNQINKGIPITFIAIAIVIAVLLIVRATSDTSDAKAFSRARVVTPVSPGKTGGMANADSVASGSSDMALFVPLMNTETLINILSLDMNNDMVEDQVVAVLRENVPHLVLIVGIYNAERNTYTRAAEVATAVSRVRTFTFTGIDMTGEHKNELVYQGVKDDGTNIMEIFMVKEERARFELLKIGSFESDGTIFIQQDDRSLSYELSQSRGASFPVWVYSSAQDESGGENANLSQIQTEYRWSEPEQQYVETRQIRVTGSRIAAQELARIQDGTVDTFANFLHGLWYKTANAQDSIRYVFFDYASKEVIFLHDDTQEVYSWEDSNLRRGGMYIMTTNESITNMQRRCDISLAGIDEVRMHIIDDVRMIIKESNLWDGNYRKMSGQSQFAEPVRSSSVGLAAELAKSAWAIDSGFRISFANGAYALADNSISDSGIFIVGAVSGKDVIQFRSSSQGSILANAYEIRFGTVALSASARRSSEAQVDYNTLYLVPVRLSPDAVYPAEGRTLTLTRESD
ncbi:MAG: pallilysin-related adhesin [Treponema sp.]|nr:pallilysin-related adhesin [Treponema sp.]